MIWKFHLLVIGPLTKLLLVSSRKTRNSVLKWFVNIPENETFETLFMASMAQETCWRNHNPVDRKNLWEYSTRFLPGCNRKGSNRILVSSSASCRIDIMPSLHHGFPLKLSGHPKRFWVSRNFNEIDQPLIPTGKPMTGMKFYNNNLSCKLNNK